MIRMNDNGKVVISRTAGWDGFPDECLHFAIAELSLQDHTHVLYVSSGGLRPDATQVFRVDPIFLFVRLSRVKPLKHQIELLVLLLLASQLGIHEAHPLAFFLVFFRLPSLVPQPLLQLLLHLSSSNWRTSSLFKYLHSKLDNFRIYYGVFFSTCRNTFTAIFNSYYSSKLLKFLFQVATPPVSTQAVLSHFSNRIQYYVCLTLKVRLFRREVVPP